MLLSLTCPQGGIADPSGSRLACADNGDAGAGAGAGFRAVGVVPVWPSLSLSCPGPNAAAPRDDLTTPLEEAHGAILACVLAPSAARELPARLSDCSPVPCTTVISTSTSRPAATLPPLPDPTEALPSCPHPAIEWTLLPEGVKAEAAACCAPAGSIALSAVTSSCRRWTWREGNKGGR